MALIDHAAHAVNFSHPSELAGLVGAWLDDAVGDSSLLTDGVRVVTAT